MPASVRARRTLLRIASVAIASLCAACATSAEAPQGPTAGKPSSPVARPPAAAVPVMPDPTRSTIGPLFGHGMTGTHGCTASVLDSPGGNLILTAAHCLAGSGAGLLFAPGYHDGVAPYGFWTVVGAYADDDWLSGQDADHDYAILQVAGRQPSAGATTLEAATGGNRLSTAPSSGDAVTVVGYNAGVNDEPVTCDTVVREQGAYPAFDCPGFSGGTSGSPWLVRPPDSNGLVVRALIGGPNYGGCVDSTSYSSSFGQPIFDLLSHAINDDPPDILPVPTGDGC